jgi:hypothetical protein
VIEPRYAIAVAAALAMIGCLHFSLRDSAGADASLRAAGSPPLADGGLAVLRGGPRVTIAGNRAPVLDSVELVPGRELPVGEMLRVEARAEDPDGHRVRFDYAWIVNGRRLRHSGNTLSADRLAVGDRVEVEVRASDGVESSPGVRVGPVERVNSLPEITSHPPTKSGQDRFEYRVRAHDPDDARRLRFSLVEGPAGASMDPLTGQLVWDSSRAEPGRHAVRIAVEDWIGGRATQHFEVWTEVGGEVQRGLPIAQAQ